MIDVKAFCSKITLAATLSAIKKVGTHVRLCNFKTDRVEHLLKHINQYHNENYGPNQQLTPVTCDLCLFTSTNKSIVEQHIQIVHSVESCRFC